MIEGVMARNIDSNGGTAPAKRILYCHCAYARVVPEPVKEEVLERLSASGAPFDAVADLCELSARRDPALGRLAAAGAEIRIAACFPRAVRWLFAAAGAPRPEDGVEIRNMRVESAAEVAAAILDVKASPAGAAGPEPEEEGS
jgi:hypothetical protein